MYTEALNDSVKLFAISSNAQLIEKTKEYEKSVKDIIEREDFTLKFIFDTYEMDSENIIMQDASPIILDSNTFEMFPIGVFISVAEKLKISSEFDKLLIQKVLDYVSYEKIDHKIVINLSIQSLTNRKFLSWLEGQLLYNKVVKDKLIFSITSYNAKEHLEKFKNLVEIIHKFESKVMLKRFSLEDFDLDELDNLDIDYIRLNRDYCNNIDEDRSKKHAIKKVILYGEMNDIYVLGDSVKSDEDYKTMSRLGLYATSK
jgi:EAL domain-containing protein (putative c-di-GMP-specific phosphodiesterase class I)